MPFAPGAYALLLTHEAIDGMEWLSPAAKADARRGDGGTVTAYVNVGFGDGPRRVIVAGLDTDFRGEPFGSMPILMAEAENVAKLHAICMVCGDDASRTQRLVNGQPARHDDPVVIVGASEMYEARCRQHHEVPR